MNGLSLCLLTPDADAPLMTPRSVSHCELGFRRQFMCRKIKPVVYYHYNMMHGYDAWTGRHKEFPEMHLTFTKLRLLLSGWFCRRLPLGAEIAQVKIMLFIPYHPLSPHLSSSLLIFHEKEMFRLGVLPCLDLCRSISFHVVGFQQDLLT